MCVVDVCIVCIVFVHVCIVYCGCLYSVLMFVHACMCVLCVVDVSGSVYCVL